MESPLGIFHIEINYNGLHDFKLNFAKQLPNRMNSYSVILMDKSYYYILYIGSLSVEAMPSCSHRFNVPITSESLLHNTPISNPCNINQTPPPSPQLKILLHQTDCYSRCLPRDHLAAENTDVFFSVFTLFFFFCIFKQASEARRVTTSQQMALLLLYIFA